MIGRIAEWRQQNRGGVGIIALDTSKRNGDMVKLRLVLPDDQVMVITDGGQVIRTRVEEIRESGRNTQGVRVIRLSEGERVVDVEPVAETDDEDEGDVAGGSDGSNGGGGGSNGAGVAGA